jgi:hypothetical protein
MKANTISSTVIKGRPAPSSIALLIIDSDIPVIDIDAANIPANEIIALKLANLNVPSVKILKKSSLLI